MKFAAIVFFAFCGAAYAEPLSVDQLMRSPERYADQAVRVVGQVDNCVAQECNLCPEDMTRATFDQEDCVRLDFDGYATGNEDGAAAQMREAFRFATIVADAHFTGTALSGARVAHVSARKTAAEGLVSWYREGRLVAPDRTETRAMQAAWDTLGLWSGEPAQFFVLARYSLQRSNASASGLGCVCVRGGCDGHWPTHYFGGFNAPANPFRCYEMEKFADGWRLMPD